MNTRVQKFVKNIPLAATITTAQPAPTVVDQGFPVSDYVYRRINLRHSGTTTFAGSSGTVLDRGGLRFLRSIRLETDKHAVIMDNLDGLSLEHILAVRGKRRAPASDVADATTGNTNAWSYGLQIPLYDFEAARPEDTGLDVLLARPTLTFQHGIGSDFASTSTNTVATAPMEITVDLDPKAGKTAADMPLMMPYFFLHRESISATTASYKISLPFGDRIYKRIYICQRTSNDLAPAANTIIGANDTDRVSLHLNGYPWIDRVEWLDLQKQYEIDYMHTAPTGVAVLDFCPRYSKGYKYSDALNTITPNNGTLDLFVDATAASAYSQIWVVGECLKNIPAGAIRALPSESVK